MPLPWLLGLELSVGMVTGELGDGVGDGVGLGVGDGVGVGVGDGLCVGDGFGGGGAWVVVGGGGGVYGACPLSGATPSTNAGGGKLCTG